MELFCVEPSHWHHFAYPLPKEFNQSEIEGLYYSQRVCSQFISHKHNYYVQKDMYVLISSPAGQHTISAPSWPQHKCRRVGKGNQRVLHATPLDFWGCAIGMYYAFIQLRELSTFHYSLFSRTFKLMCNIIAAWQLPLAI